MERRVVAGIADTIPPGGHRDGRRCGGRARHGRTWGGRRRGCVRGRRGTRRGKHARRREPHHENDRVTRCPPSHAADSGPNRAAQESIMDSEPTQHAQPRHVPPPTSRRPTIATARFASAAEPPDHRQGPLQAALSAHHHKPPSFRQDSRIGMQSRVSNGLAKRQDHHPQCQRRPDIRGLQSHERVVRLALIISR
jgi:hypothetical protein